MKNNLKYFSFIVPLLCLMFGVVPSYGVVSTQCPATIIDSAGNTSDPNVLCKHLAAGDGFINMADGREMYIFGYSDVTGLPDDMVMHSSMLNSTFPAPTITVKEGQKLYLTLTNVGFVMRPDLFDSHTVHWHGFGNAAPVFDGEPMGSFGINMGSSLAYFYNVTEPGTYLYHCHVEAPEHMQMGMLGNLYVTPKQDGTSLTYQGKTYTQFAYNDGDGSTGYDVAYPIQISAFDPKFHDADLNVQPLNFANMKDTYPMLNGRGYPDTVNPNVLNNSFNGMPSQPMNSLIRAKQGDRILLRLSSVSTTGFHTVSVLGIPMKVVGKDARILRGPTGTNLYYDTNTITLGGGQTADVMLDTAGLPAGSYFLYSTNLEHLNNDQEDLGGMMTEIIIF